MRMSRSLFAAAAAVLGTTVLGACASSGSTNGGDMAAGGAASAEAGPQRTLVANLRGRGNGDITLVSTPDGRMRVTLEASGLPRGSARWRIRSGQCGDPAALEIASSAAFRQLQVGSDGRTSIRNQAFNIPFPGNGVHHVQLLDVSGGSQFACGNLSPA